MSGVLRIALLVGAVGMFLYICRSIRKSKTQMKDTIVWILIALLLMVFGIFPVIPMTIAAWVGIESPANMIFLIFISVLLYINFSLSMRVSMLEDKNATMAAEIAIRSSKEYKKAQEKDNE